MSLGGFVARIKNILLKLLAGNYNCSMGLTIHLENLYEFVIYPIFLIYLSPLHSSTSLLTLPYSSSCFAKSSSSFTIEGVMIIFVVFKTISIIFIIPKLIKAEVSRMYSFFSELPYYLARRLRI